MKPIHLISPQNLQEQVCFCKCKLTGIILILHHQKGRGAKRDESGRMINHIAYSEQLRRDKTGNHTAVIIIADEKKQHGKTPVDKDIIISISDSDEEMDAETLIIEQN
ncbi:hypothetical protein OIU76_011779 [Salix suchowensis]|nr:hypothetical protein OIU76_011779 [Salix suchowensis]